MVAVVEAWTREDWIGAGGTGKVLAGLKRFRGQPHYLDVVAGVGPRSPLFWGRLSSSGLGAWAIRARLVAGAGALRL